jgi:hypothetical protein
VRVYGNDGPSVSFTGEFSPNFDLKINMISSYAKDFSLKKKKKDPSSPDFEFFFSPNRQIF